MAGDVYVSVSYTTIGGREELEHVSWHRKGHAMDYELDDTHEQFRAVVRDFAMKEIAPHAERWDAEHTFPVDVVRGMGEIGLFGLPFPEEYGGGGADLTTLCIAIEEIGVPTTRWRSRSRPACRWRGADPPLRHRGTEAGVVAPSVCRVRRSARSG